MESGLASHPYNNSILIFFYAPDFACPALHILSRSSSLRVHRQAEEIVTKAQADAAALVAELATQATVRGGQASAPVTVAAPQRASPAMSSLKVVAQSAERLFVGALMRMRFSRLTKCAYSMCLQSSNLRSNLVSVSSPLRSQANVQGSRQM